MSLCFTVFSSRRDELNEFWLKVIAIDKVTEFNKHHCSSALKEFIDVDRALLGDKVWTLLALRTSSPLPHFFKILFLLCMSSHRRKLYPQRTQMLPPRKLPPRKMRTLQRRLMKAVLDLRGQGSSRLAGAGACPLELAGERPFFSLMCCLLRLKKPLSVPRSLLYA